MPRGSRDDGLKIEKVVGYAMKNRSRTAWKSVHEDTNLEIGQSGCEVGFSEVVDLEEIQDVVNGDLVGSAHLPFSDI